MKNPPINMLPHELIAAINDRFKGDFAEADSVIIGVFYARLLKDEKLRNKAETALLPQVLQKNRAWKYIRIPSPFSC